MGFQNIHLLRWPWSELICSQWTEAGALKTTNQGWQAKYLPLEDWWFEDGRQRTVGQECQAVIFFFQEACNRLRWVGKKFTRKLSSCQLGVLKNLQGIWLGTSWAHQKGTGKMPAEGRVLWNFLGSCLGLPQKDQKRYLWGHCYTGSSQWRHLQNVTNTHWGELYQGSAHQPPPLKQKEAKPARTRKRAPSFSSVLSGKK